MVIVAASEIEDLGSSPSRVTLEQYILVAMMLLRLLR
jgi:hypothetical protein